jgi:hypothetical protein
LHSGGIGARQESVVETLKPDTLPAQALLHPLVAVETECDRMWNVRADLQKCGAPVSVVNVEVER